MDTRATYRRRRIAAAIIALGLGFAAFKLVGAGWGYVQKRWEASASVTPSNPITPSQTHTHKVIGVPACSDSDVAISVFLDEDSNEFDVKSNVIIHATITNVSQQKCLRDVGSKANEIRILDTAGKQVWSSDTCPVKQSINLVELSPRDVARITLTWGGNVDPKKCGKVASHVPVGEYSIVASNGNAESEPLPIVFSAVTPTPSN